MKKTKQVVFGLFVALQAMTIILYQIRWVPAHQLAPISIAGIIAYTAFVIVTWRKS